MGVSALLSSSTMWAGTPFAIGQVFAAVGNGQVKVFSPTGTLIQTLNDGTGSTYTTGMAFDASGNLYVTNFSLGTVSKFDSSGNLVSGSFLTGGLSSPESIVFDSAGHIFTGGPSAPKIYEFAATGGTPTATFNVTGGNGTGGTDWLDLAADQHTMLYDGEGTNILSYNVASSTQNAAFATGLPGGDVYAFRIIPSGTFAGNVLAADSNNAVMLNSSGAVIKTYTLPGNSGGDFALNLDPNGTDFWTSDANSGNIWAVNIASGAIDHQFSSGNAGTTYGLTVFGQITAAGGGGAPPPTTPAPRSVLLTLAGLAVLGMWQLGRRFGTRTV